MVHAAGVSLGLSAAWHGAELIGKLVGDNEKDLSSIASSEKPKVTWEDLKAGIQKDYDNLYFVGGTADMAVYDDNCEFVDKFSSYRGLGRFRKNTTAFGKFTCAL